MSWFNVWTAIKTKTCRYLLQRYLGQFIDETIDLKQLKVDLYNGKATVKNVSLNVTALNAILEAQGWAIEIISGRIGVLTATVPWNALMSQCSCIDVEDVVISVRPVQRKTNGTSMLESMWSSASNSMQLAEECMKQHDDDTEESNQVDAKSIPGLEKFAETIDNILNRIKATFKNTFIQLEYQSSDSSKAISLRFNINELIYENVTGCMQEQRHENSPRVQTNNLEETEENKYLLPMFAKHNISICGLTVSTEELKTMSESLLYENKDFSQSCAIPIMEIREEIHFRIKMKQSENINGPKIIIESEIGSIYTLITPRQIHLILQLIDAFQNDACDKQEADYYEEKQHNDNYSYHKSNETVELGNWIDCETGPSVVNPLPRINLDKLKDLSRGYSPPSSSISSSTTLTGLSKWQRKTSSLEYSGDILSFSVKVSAFVSIVLLEDVLVETESNNISPLNKTSEQNMIDFAKEFFDHVHQLFDKKIDSAALTCGKNHLFISISPITSGGSQHRIKQMILSKINFAAQKIDLYEVLNGEPSELITFDRTENYNTPDVAVHVESDVTSKSVNIALQNCRIELDISIYDRLSAILAPSPFAAYSSEHGSQFVKQESSKLTFITNLTSTAMELILRFPIYDARPIHDPNRVPWWQKNIRPDYMIISLDHACMKFVGGKFDILTNELNAYYVDKERDDKVWILKTNSMKVNSEVIDYVKISVTIPDEYYWTSIKDNFLVGNFNDNIKPTDADSLPFSAKRFCRESDTIHNKSENMESETILLPGETIELAEFRRTTMRTSRIQVEVTVPNLHIILESKKFYEVIYNRFNTDLFMWEPSSPILNSINTICVENKQSIYNIPSSSEPQYSRFNEFDLSESEESGSFAEQNINLKGISMTESIYFSTLDSHNTEDIYREEINIKKSQFSINVSIRNGLVELFVPIRDTENQIMPEDMGKIDINVNELNIFSVNGYNSNKNVCYLCIEIDDIKMDHCGLLHEISTKLINENERNMQKTFYKTPRGLLKSNQPPIIEREMISLVIETKRVPEQRVKRIVVTTGIQQATLGYHPSITNQFWLNQLIDFLDVVDYPIEGYVPFGIITEMQLHLWNCAIDYRPTNFDYRAIVELGAFTISSNVISSVAGCNLRFIVEDFVLYIAQNKENTKSQNSNKIPIDSKYLVPVLDIGLVDISLRLNENSEKYPKFDLRCSVHDAHLRTCSDSGKALAQLIEHLANDGDTVEPEQNISSTTTLQQSRLEINETPTLVEHKRKESLTEQQDWQQERVNIMMAEALRETITLSAVPSTSKNSKLAGHGIEPFYFPDEQQPGILDDDYDCGDNLSAIVNFEHHVMSSSYCPAEPNVDVLPQIKSDLGDINNERLYSMHRRHPREDEYCVISEDERRKVSQCGVLELKLCEDPIRIVDNHFCLPSNKLDLLKPPDDFPMPVSRYTLCEMTFTWHLYGGKDFLTTTDDISAKDDPGHFRMSDAYKHGVSYSKGSNSVSGSKKSKDLSWKTIGGVQRNHDILVEIQLTKVRLSHEIYPTHITQASRQVLVIHDIEIRDRLKSSEINKFLYNPNFKTTSQKCPQQMLVVKALHVRPKPIISSAQECSLRISLLPMRLNIDQDTLIFLADYFTNIGSKMKETNLSDNNQPAEAHAPIMDVELTEDEEDLQARNLISTNLELLENEVIDKTEKQSEEIEKSSPIYFREVIFGPDVSIRFDYHGRRVELSRGPIAGLLMGLGQLQCSEIKLKKIIYRRGFLGVDKLVAYLCREWLKDIKRNQLPKILKGVGPTYSFVQFIQGVIDLFRLPIEQYQRDGRLIRGIQLGAQSFTARTALAALEITSRVIQILQFTAETAFDMVSSGPSIRTIRRHRRDRKRRSNRPKDMREGVTNAYLILKEGINESAATLIETAAAEHDQKGYTGAVGAVMRQLPQLVVCPAVLATQATTNILGGVKSSLVPDAKVEAREKWKTDID
ncbi:autophagy-related protein 2 homolog A [Bactrocera tryoni]|uniref:autophagy-related protein 2 homolog A n=1 Tax=Bactrocera tryoni TaxID=59916 RepID=UPI001A9A2B16|nr:autophagy-related protein 2 homolog A [Bactrocera tryoni]